MLLKHAEPRLAGPRSGVRMYAKLLPAFLCLSLVIASADDSTGSGAVVAPATSHAAPEASVEEQSTPPVDVYFGRYDLSHPAQHCCRGTDCLARSTGRFAIVTTVRTSEYMTCFRELHCSLLKSNPGTKLIVLGVEGDLTAAQISELEQVAEYRIVEDFSQVNDLQPRFSKNWVKLRAWQWEDYDALIMLDSDMVVLGDITHLFQLPTDFAWAPMQGHSGWTHNRGGFVMLRPCRQTFDSMMQLMLADEELLYKHGRAEQSFLSWFFRYTAFELSMKYNFNFDFLVNGRTSGGEEPLIIHFADKKPFHAQPEDPEWPYLCWQATHNASVGASAM